MKKGELVVGSRTIIPSPLIVLLRGSGLQFSHDHKIALSTQQCGLAAVNLSHAEPRVPVSEYAPVLEPNRADELHLRARVVLFSPPVRPPRMISQTLNTSAAISTFPIFAIEKSAKQERGRIGPTTSGSTVAACQVWPVITHLKSAHPCSRSIKRASQIATGGLKALRGLDAG
jgi:hypothetical protein